MNKTIIAAAVAATFAAGAAHAYTSPASPDAWEDVQSGEFTLEELADNHESPNGKATANARVNSDGSVNGSQNKSTRFEGPTSLNDVLSYIHRLRQLRRGHDPSGTGCSSCATNTYPNADGSFGGLR